MSDFDLYNSQNKFLIILTIISAVFSITGSILIISTYIFFKKIRNYAFKLVMYLSISDIFLSVGNLLAIVTLKQEGDQGLCKLQSFLVNFGGLSSILWTSVIAWNIYAATVLSQRNFKQKNKKFLLFGYGLPLLMSVIPFLSHQYGRTGYFCWIKSDEHNAFDVVMRFFQFYIPLWIALGFNIYAYVKVIKFIRKHLSRDMEVRFIHRLKYYPLVLAFCWSFATVNRLYEIVGKEIFILTVLHHGCGGLQGFLNAIVYGMNENVKQTWKKKLCWFLIPKSHTQFEDVVNKETNELKRDEELQNRDSDINVKYQYSDQSGIEKDLDLRKEEEVTFEK